MSTVERRVRKLELVHGARNARLIVVAVAANGRDGEVDAFLARSGIQPTDADLVVCVRRRFDATAADRPVLSLLDVRGL